MSQARELYLRFRHLIHEGAKFGIVGLTGILITNLVFAPLHNELGLGVLTAVTVATVVATVFTFLGNRYWSFRGREGTGTGKEGVTFFVLNGIGLLIQYAVLGLSHHALGLTTKVEDQLAVNIGIGIGTLFRFWSYRKFVWVSAEERLARLRRGRHRKGRAAPAPAPAGIEVGFDGAGFDGSGFDGTGFDGTEFDGTGFDDGVAGRIPSSVEAAMAAGPVASLRGRNRPGQRFSVATPVPDSEQPSGREPEGSFGPVAGYGTRA